MQAKAIRQQLQSKRRLVVKLGSRVLIRRDGRPDLQRMRHLVAALADLQRAGREIILVTSGAIGSGMHALGMSARPTQLPDLQMAAAVGQSRLMTLYDRLFSARRCRIGQVLLTHDDLKNRRRHLNARNTMLNLLRHDIIPIVNENDVVAVDEIKFGENDLLAGLVALLVEADLVLLLSTVDGFRAPAGAGRTRRISWLRGVGPADLALAVGRGSTWSTGGMASKLQAADMVARAGIPVVIANGRQPNVIARVAQGEDVGTLIAAGPAGGGLALDGRKRWIAYFHRTRGALVVDAGAREALKVKGRSLLPIGVRTVEGEFERGAVVDVKTAAGGIFARGLVEYSSADLRQIAGHRTSDIAAILGARDYDEVIHRDNMVLLDAGPTGGNA